MLEECLTALVNIPTKQMFLVPKPVSRLPSDIVLGIGKRLVAPSVCETIYEALQRIDVSSYLSETAVEGGRCPLSGARHGPALTRDENAKARSGEYQFCSSFAYLFN